MELVYLWVEDYKNIKKQGFNFSPRFRCEYDEDAKELEIIDKDETGEFYIKNFFGDNINITTIVGVNGSGKSNILDLILDSDGWSQTNRKSFFICLELDTLVIYFLNIDVDIKCNRTYKKEEINRIENDTSVSKGINLNISFLTLSPFIHNINNIYSNSIDLQSIYNYLKTFENKLFNFEKFFLSLIPGIPEILDNDYVKTFFNIKIKPKYLVFKINKYIETLYPEELRYILDNSNKKNETDKTYLQTISLTESSILGKIFELFYKIEEKKIAKEIEFNKLEDFKKKRKIPNINNEEIFNRVNMVNDLKENNNDKKKEKLKKDILELGEIEFSFAEKSLSENIFNFSTGELVLLFYIKKLQDINKKEHNIILLIDECELFLHPEWQKKFIYLLSDLFKDNEYNRQIILSSHSPFILSDLPKGNVVFLEKGKQVYPFEDGKQTFGANIHTLLSHGFFMKDGLMGQFAKDKIQSIIKYYEEILKAELTKEENKTQRIIEKRKYEKEHKAMFWQIQSIIGDDYLKQVIKNHLIEIEKILYDKYLIDEEIDKLQKQIDKLKKIKDA